MEQHSQFGGMVNGVGAQWGKTLKAKLAAKLCI